MEQPLQGGTANLLSGTWIDGAAVFQTHLEQTIVRLSILGSKAYPFDGNLGGPIFAD